MPQPPAVLGGGAADPTSWIAAYGSMAADLAAFQATAPMAASFDINDVVTAMEPAYKLGFAWSMEVSHDDLTVRLLHRSGWDHSSTVPTEDANELLTGQLLANLLGIRVAVSAATAQPQPTVVPPTPKAAAKPQPEPQVAAPEPIAEPDEAPADLIGEGSPDTEVLPENLQPLSAADRDTCIAVIKAMSPDARKSFTIEFRNHFNIDREARTISGFITQVQHQQFVQAFLDELELQGVAA